MPAASLDSYDDNSFLAGAVDKIAQELSTTQFYLQIVDDDDEIEIIRQHQALDTLKKPQPTKKGKGVLTGMDLELVTGYHLCLMGEAFWLLDKRMKIGGAPQFIDMLLPEYMNPIIKNGEIVEYIYGLPRVRADTEAAKLHQGAGKPRHATTAVVLHEPSWFSRRPRLRRP